jgi:hypothetical protein
VNGLRASLLLFVGLLASCKAEGSPQNSSGSHWVRCSVDAVCTPYDALATCDEEGYCVDSSGERLEALDSEPEPLGGGGQGSLAPAAGGGAGEGSLTPAAGGSGGEGSVTPAAGGAQNSAGEGGANGGTGGAAPGAGGASGASDCPELPPPNPENVFDGDYVVTDAASIAAARLFSEITGSLSLSQRTIGDFDEVSLPELARVGGSVVATQSRLARLELPRLSTIGGDLELDDNPELVLVDLASLEDVAGSVSLSGNPILAELSLPRLKTVGGAIQLSVLPLCLGQPIYDAVGMPGEYEGRADCTCETLCGRSIATCP